MVSGTLLGVAAFSLWGTLPLFWKRLDSVSPLQILAHRILWAFIFSISATLLFPSARKELMALLRDRRRILALALAGLLISVNWGIYIWAVNASRIVETSMGYYLNPLVSVLLGSLVFRERIDRGMAAASLLALVGIGILVVSYGKLPWVTLSLAISFALYGAIKKLAALSGLVGLAAETAVVAPFALAYLLSQNAQGSGAFWHGGLAITALLALAGPVTALPLLCYAEGVNRIPLSRMGFLQYISPTLQLGLGVFLYGEELDSARLWAFAFILIALAVFAFTKRNGGAGPAPRAPGDRADEGTP